MLGNNCRGGRQAFELIFDSAGNFSGIHLAQRGGGAEGD